jgi:ABC-2 type transport system permease protein
LESAGTVELKSEEMEMISTFMANMASIDFTMLGLGFVIYFVGGYFFYASLFAAAASAANDASDLNSLSFPITFPLIVSFFILNAAIQDPDGALAFWFSMIPLTSPVVMIGRIPFGVPWWEFILSIVLLIGGFVATAWVAARIYRVGILLYGKKHSLIELLRWIRTAG